MANERLAAEWSEPLRKAGVDHETLLVEDYAAAALLIWVEKRRANQSAVWFGLFWLFALVVLLMAVSVRHLIQT